MTSFTDINIETLVLVTAWGEPSVFQGCFKISDKCSTRKRFIFFRCESKLTDKMQLLEDAFSPYDYEWTYLYEEMSKVTWDVQDESKEHAIYVLKYALHTTLVNLLHNRKYDFASIDEVAMQSMIEHVKPMLQTSALSWGEEYPDLGFAVAMDFLPSEMMGEQAAVQLLGKRSAIH